MFETLLFSAYNPGNLETGNEKCKKYIILSSQIFDFNETN